jgi:polar amino acid transport system substrate-binding protein
MKKLILSALIITVSAALTPLEPQERPDRAAAYRTVRERGTVKIGVSEHYPPLNFGNGSRGLEMEMASGLGAFLGVKVQLVPLKLADYVPALEKGEVDLVIAGLSRNLSRAKKIWFSEPYLSITPAALVSKRILPQTRFGDQFEQAPFRTVWDLKRLSGFKCAVKSGSSYVELLEFHFPGITRIVVADNTEGFESITSGAAQGFIHDSLYLHYMYRKNAALGSSFALLAGGENVEEICVGLPFGDTVLKNQVDIFIAEMKRQGHITRWLEKFSGE